MNKIIFSGKTKSGKIKSGDYTHDEKKDKHYISCGDNVLFEIDEDTLSYEIEGDKVPDFVLQNRYDLKEEELPEMYFTLCDNYVLERLGNETTSLICGNMSPLNFNEHCAMYLFIEMEHPADIGAIWRNKNIGKKVTPEDFVKIVKKKCPKIESEDTEGDDDK